MDAFLLAAGRGSRLGALTQSTPKCLVPIAGRPLLDYWLEQLDSCSAIGRIFLNVHYLAEQVLQFLAACPFARKVKVVEEDRLWGTGGSLARLVTSEGPFEEGLFVAHADNLSLFSLESFLVSHNARPKFCLATAMTFETDSPSSCGIVELDAQKVVTALFEKVACPPGRLANGAVFIFTSEALRQLCVAFHDLLSSVDSKEEVYDLSRDFLPKLIGKLFTFHNDIYHRDIGTKDSYHKALNDFILKKNQTTIFNL